MPKSQRVNRATLAIFKFESGAVGSLSHTLLLHGSNFFTELDIYGDGFHILVKDPYNRPAVLIRRPRCNDYEEVRSCIYLFFQGFRGFPCWVSGLLPSGVSCMSAAVTGPVQACERSLLGRRVASPC